MKLLITLAIVLMSTFAYASTQGFTAAKIPGPEEKAVLVTWAALLTGNTGIPIQNPTYAVRTVQVGGTFGGSTVTIEGSNDGVTYYTLNDTAATPAAVSFTSAGFKKILELPRYIRPKVASGSAASIDVNLLMVKP